MNNKPLLYTLIAILGIAAVGATAAYVHEKEKAPGVEIRLDKNGLKIQEN